MTNMALFLLFTHSHFFSVVGIASIVMSSITVGGGGAGPGAEGAGLGAKGGRGQLLDIPVRRGGAGRGPRVGRGRRGAGPVGARRRGAGRRGWAWA